MVTEYELWEFSRTLPKDTVKKIWYQSIFTDKRMIDNLRELYEQEQAGQTTPGTPESGGMDIGEDAAMGGEREANPDTTASAGLRCEEGAQAEEAENS